jgi:hypothetical protein
MVARALLLLLCFLFQFSSRERGYFLRDFADRVSARSDHIGRSLNALKKN